MPKNSRTASIAVACAGVKTVAPGTGDSKGTAVLCADSRRYSTTRNAITTAATMAATRIQRWSARVRNVRPPFAKMES